MVAVFKCSRANWLHGLGMMLSLRFFLINRGTGVCSELIQVVAATYPCNCGVCLHDRIGGLILSRAPYWLVSLTAFSLHATLSRVVNTGWAGSICAILI